MEDLVSRFEKGHEVLFDEMDNLEDLETWESLGCHTFQDNFYLHTEINDYNPKPYQDKYFNEYKEK